MNDFANSLKFARFSADFKGDCALLWLGEFCCIVQCQAVAFSLPAVARKPESVPQRTPTNSRLRVNDRPVSTGGYDVNSGNVPGRLPCRQVQVPAADRVQGPVRARFNGRRAGLVRIRSGIGNRLPPPIALQVIRPRRRLTKGMKGKSETEPACEVVRPAPEAAGQFRSGVLPSVTWVTGACRRDTVSFVIRL